MVDGMLAGLFARAPLPQITQNGLSSHAAMGGSDSGADERQTVTILWASQTGNAEGFAARCADRLKSAGYVVRLAGMADCKVDEIVGVRNLLLLASTFGDGDPPDNGSAFWAGLESSTAPKLVSTRFSVLAFGDSNYDQFCGFGRKLEARFEKLGAQRLAPRMDCEPDFKERGEEWLDAVLCALRVTADPVTQAEPTKNYCSPIAFEQCHPTTEVKAIYSRHRPLRTRVLTNCLLNGPGAEKETRYYAFDASAPEFSYEAGDAMGVWPTNCPKMVDGVIAALGLSSSVTVAIGDKEFALEEALSGHYEIARITPELLEFLADHSDAEELAELLHAERKDERKKWLWGRQVIDLLEAFPVRISAQEFLALLKPLQPRLYSISSSPKLHPLEAHLTVSTLRYMHHGRTRGGVCSTFLADRAQEEELRIFVQRTAHFRPPKDPNTPMIMVGPGTGIAPFRAFLQERRAIGAKGKNWLFFGEQRAATDFYYREELEALEKADYIHRLDTAFSRDRTEKQYVQDRMLERGVELWTWLENGAHFYVCGDASRMARDVDAALKKVVEIHGAMSADRAGEYVARLSQDKRYVRDVY